MVPHVYRNKMFFSILFVALCFCGALAAPSTRVIGGKPANLGEIPYIISLRIAGRHNCGGSILDKRHVLTAAHCVYGNDAYMLQIQYGVIDVRSKENIIQVTKISIHEGFSAPGNYPNDIAVLTLGNDIIFGDNVKATILPSSVPNVPGESITARLSGWGYSQNMTGVERYLLTAEFPLFNDDICDEYLSGMYNPTYHVCAGDLDGSRKQCSGDSGGPLIADGVQHGVVSWSYKPCTISNRPGVFTRVASYVDWIKKNMV